MMNELPLDHGADEDEDEEDDVRPPLCSREVRDMRDAQVEERGLHTQTHTSVTNMRRTPYEERHTNG